MIIAHTILRYAHITGGMLALAAGAGAMIYPKGSQLHRQHGKLFFIAMTVMASTGLYISIFITPVAANVMGALMALYLTSTAWATVWRKPGVIGRLEIALALLGLTTAVTGLTFGFRATASPNGMFDQFPAVGYFVFAGVVSFGTLLDVRMIARGGFIGPVRLTRHLWRMSFALFMATGSFFFGQAKLFPAEVRQSGVLAIPALLPFGLMLYWLVKVRIWPLVKKAWVVRVSQRAT